MNNVHDDPSDTTAEAGVVLIDGPGGTALSMTPKAAKQTSERLSDSAGKAADQKDGKSTPDE